MDPPPARTNRPSRTVIVFVLASCLVAGSAIAHKNRVACGRVSVRNGQPASFEHQLKSEVSTQIAHLNETAWRGGPYVINVALVELSTQEGRFGLETKAVLQAVLLHQDSGDVLAGSRGQAVAASGGGERSLSVRSAMRRATENALSELLPQSSRL